MTLEKVLLKSNMVSEKQLARAKVMHEKEGMALLEVLIGADYVEEEKVAELISRETGLPYLPLNTDKLKPLADENLEDLFTREFALEKLVLPLSRTVSSLTVAMADPCDEALKIKIEQLSGCKVKTIVVCWSDMLRAIKKFYAKGEYR